MSNVANSALVAVLVGCIGAVILFVPFVAMSFRRLGHVGFTRVIGWFAVLISACSLWTYTLLPGPSSEDYRCRSAQLNPGQFIQDIRDHGLSSASQVLHNPALLQFAFNIALFVPVGFLLRSMWRRGILFAGLLGLLTSLLIETTQLTGVFGLFRCAYRVFDVDDLIANTAGALIGSIIAIPFARRALPSREVIRPVSGIQRLLGMISDVLIFGLAAMAISVGIRALSFYGLNIAWEDYDDTVERLLSLGVPLLFIFLHTVATGQTFGDRVVQVIYVRDGKRLNYALRVIRAFTGIVGIAALWIASQSNDAFGFMFFTAVVISLAMAVWTKTHRGLPGIITGSELVSSRILDQESDRADAPDTPASVASPADATPQTPA